MIPLNPRLFESLVKILFALQRLGVQVFVTTHDYAIPKEFELVATEEDQVRYHVLYRTAGVEGVWLESHDKPFMLDHSSIADAMSSLYDRELKHGVASWKGPSSQ